MGIDFVWKSVSRSELADARFWYRFIAVHPKKKETFVVRKHNMINSIYRTL